jgi:predicted LPLAT superfamily acyltransferase
LTQEWQRRPEGGNAFGFRLIRTFALGCGRAAARLVLFPITAYFLARRGPERRASRQYLERVLGRRVTLRDVARHVHCFSCTTLDRVFLLSERFKRFQIRTFGLQELDRALARGRGLLLFGSHLGSFEALRVLSLERPEVPVRILLDVEQGPALSTTLNALNPALAATIINARGGGPAVTIAIKEALDRNAIVALLVDRAQAGQAVLPAQFLGHPAPFPTAPWLLAATLKIPVILSFGLYRGGNRYDLHFETFSDCVTIERRDRAAALGRLVQQFADRLAHYARLAPDNWFNFYDFWHSEATDGEAGTAAPAAGGSLVRRS